jgi:hypothetical protein
VKITMLTTLPGFADGYLLTKGAVVDINEHTAEFLIAEGQAEPFPKLAVAPPPAVKTAEVEAPRNAAARTGKPKARTPK